MVIAYHFTSLPSETLWLLWQYCPSALWSTIQWLLKHLVVQKTSECILLLLMTKSHIDKSTRSGRTFSPKNCSFNRLIRRAWTFGNCWNTRTPRQRQQPRVCQLLSLPPECQCVRVQGQECVAPTGGPHGLLEWRFSSQFQQPWKKASVWTRWPHRNLNCTAAPSRRQLTAAEMAATHAGRSMLGRRKRF